VTEQKLEVPADNRELVAKTVDQTERAFFLRRRKRIYVVRTSKDGAFACTTKRQSLV
jgi:hypothetical protein